MEGDLTALLWDSSESGGVFVRLRAGSHVDLVNEGARAAGWCAWVLVVRENIERALRNVVGGRRGAARLQ